MWNDNFEGNWLDRTGGRRDAFFDKVRKDGCWLWVGAIDKDGYGKFKLQGKMCFAHRVSFESYKGAIPEGMSIDHVCRVRNCVNPDHLQATTHRDNVLRGNRKNRSLLPSAQMLPKNIFFALILNLLLVPGGGLEPP